MIYNRIPVQIGPVRKVTGPPINYKYDEKQVLVIQGLQLPAYYQVDFCNAGDARTVTMVGGDDGVQIPDQFLQTGKAVKAFIVLTGETEGAVETRYEITLPVNQRPARSDIQPTPEEQSTIDSLVEAMTDAVDRSEGSAEASETAQGKAEDAQAAAEDAQAAAEAAVAHYPKIENGYWYVWQDGAWVNTGVKAEGLDGVGIASVTGEKTSTSGLTDTYTMTVTYTDGNIDTLTFTVTNGADGTDGTDGVSPEVTITSIPGGHQVTITDADHPSGQSFDVMDGEVSEAELQAGLNQKAPVIIDTASGAIASFPDGADGMPIKRLVANIEPVQDLHGYDSPWPAGGGKNLFDPDSTEKYWVGVGGSYGEATNAKSVTLQVSSGDTFTISSSNPRTATNILCLAYYDESDNNLSRVIPASTGYSATATAPTGAVKLIACCYTYSEAGNVQLEKGSTPTAFAPYSNLCPISGWTGCEIQETGINVWDEQWELGIYDNSNGTPQSNNNRIRSKNPIAVKPNTTYYLYCGDSNIGIVVHYYDENGTQISTSNTKNTTITTPANCSHIKFNSATTTLTTYGNNISINYPSSDHDYHAYSGESIPISWQSEAGTVYGGYATLNEDGSVVLTVDHFLYVYNGTETFRKSGTALNGFYNNLTTTADMGNHDWPLMLSYQTTLTPITNEISSMFKMTRNTDYYKQNYGVCYLDSGMNFNVDPAMFGTTNDSFKAKLAELYAAGTPVSVFCKIATPLTYTLPSITALTSLLGQNNVWASTGDVSVEYRADTKLYLEKLTAPTEDDLIADHAITSGSFFMIGNTLYRATTAIANGATITPGTNATRLSLADALNLLNT